MNLYINPDNQKLLWNIISNNQYITNFFYMLSPADKESWFKSIIEKIYFDNQHKILTYEGLKELNKQTLAYMLQNIKDRNKPHIQQPAPIQPDIQQSTYNQINTPPVIKENKSDIFQEQYDQRQQTYQNMVKTEVPKDIDFSTKVEDGAIQNMDELIKKQQEERQLDIQQFKPPPLTNDNPLKLNIDNSTDVSIEQETETIVNSTKETTSQQKQVSWGGVNIYFDNEEAMETFTMHQEDVSIIHNQYSQLNNEVTKLNDEIEMIKEQLSKILKNNE